MFGEIHIVLESFLQFVGERIIVYYSANHCGYDWINLVDCIIGKPGKKFVKLPTKEHWFDFYNHIVQKLAGKNMSIIASDNNLGRLYWNLLSTNQDDLVQENFKFSEYFLQIGEVDMTGPLQDSIFLWNIVMCFADSLTTNFNRDVNVRDEDTISGYAVSMI